MAFCAILLSGLVLTCKGLDQSKVHNQRTNLPLAQPGVYGNKNYPDQKNYTIRPSQINLMDTLQDHGTQNQSHQLITEELMKARWPSEALLDDYDYYISRNETSTTNQTQTNENQKYPNNQIQNNNFTSHVFSSGGTRSTADNNTISIQQRPISEGEPVSAENWGFTRVPGGGLLTGQKVTAQTPLLQWHVGVYSKAFEPYMQICGGTLVTTKAVISAAHCFWSDLDGAMPASWFIIAAGKLYRPWNDFQDRHAQKSEVSAVKLPSRFRGATTSFQDDIAVVLLATPFSRSAALRPLCVRFDDDLEDTHLRDGEQGVVLGWGLTAENGPPAQALQYLYMPYVQIEECIAGVETNFLKYITSDKICAGVTTGKALCRGDSGGGLVFFDRSSSNDRVPLLFGVASTAPRNEHTCNTYARATLTRVLAHRGFLRTHIPDIEEACAKNYASASETKADSLDDRTAVTNECQPQQPNIKLVCNCYCNNSTKP